MSEKRSWSWKMSPALQKWWVCTLQPRGVSGANCTDGKQAMTMLEKRIPDLVVLDLMLPEVDGLSLTRWLRDRSDVPIIMVTARREEIDRIAGLEMGADDYVVKPFSPQELVSRVRAVLRRIGREQARRRSPSEPLTFGDLSIDPLSRVSLSEGRNRPDCQRVRHAVSAGAASETGFHARAIAGAGVGRAAVYRSRHRDGACPPRARENRNRPVQPNPSGDRLGRGV